MLCKCLLVYNLSPPSLATYPYLSAEHLFAGSIFDLVALDRSIAVSFAASPVDRCDPLSAPSGKIAFVDPDAMRVIETSTAPACLVRVMRDPSTGSSGDC